MDSSLGDNQTEIVYSVFVNGIPVWAVIAADDMKFMRRDEVADILGMSVAIVAERTYRKLRKLDRLDFIGIHDEFSFYIFQSLSEGATSHPTDTIINEFPIRQTNNSNADSKSIYFYLSNDFIGIDNIAAYGFDVGGR